MGKAVSELFHLQWRVVWEGIALAIKTKRHKRRQHSEIGAALRKALLCVGDCVDSDGPTKGKLIWHLLDGEILDWALPLANFTVHWGINEWASLPLLEGDVHLRSYGLVLYTSDPKDVLAP